MVLQAPPTLILIPAELTFERAIFLVVNLPKVTLGALTSENRTEIHFGKLLQPCLDRKITENRKALQFRREGRGGMN